MSYHVRRIDRNQPEIVARFRKLGCSVAITSSLGAGMVDIVIGVPRENLEPYTALIEIKDGEKPMSARKLTPDEQKFHDNWKGNIHIISSEQEVDDLIKRVRYG